MTDGIPGTYFSPFLFLEGAGPGLKANGENTSNLAKYLQMLTIFVEFDFE